MDKDTSREILSAEESDATVIKSQASRGMIKEIVGDPDEFHRLARSRIHYTIWKKPLSFNDVAIRFQATAISDQGLVIQHEVNFGIVNRYDSDAVAKHWREAQDYQTTNFPTATIGVWLHAQDPINSEMR